jgi:hypothetical protein
MNPAADKIPAVITAILCPAHPESLAPRRPPMQKKLIAKVKFKARSEAPHPNSADNGDFKIDQAYRMPANNIATTPMQR